MSNGHDGVTQLRDRVRAVASSATDGAHASVDIASRSRGHLRAVSHEDADTILARLASDLRAVAPAANWVRTAWTRHEGVLVGSRAELAELAQCAVGRLASSPLAWIIALTRIMPDDPERTLFCDANYDLVKLSTTSAVWIEPYPHDDWRESQRYPSVEIIAPPTPTGSSGDGRR